MLYPTELRAHRGKLLCPTGLEPATSRVSTEVSDIFTTVMRIGLAGNGRKLALQGSNLHREASLPHGHPSEVTAFFTTADLLVSRGTFGFGLSRRTSCQDEGTECLHHLESRCRKSAANSEQENDIVATLSL